MLPPMIGQIPLSKGSKEKLEFFYERFCEGKARKTYGLGHLIYACHAAFPLLLSPQLANLIWLNFRNYRTEGGNNRINQIFTQFVF